MTVKNGLPLRVILGLVLAIAIDTGLQILWKFAALSIPPGPLALTGLPALLVHPLFLAVGLTLVLQLVNWTAVLAHADLSYAQPITALSYISVLAMSAWVLHETISLEKVAGVVLVFVGVWLISRTDHKTERRAEPAP